MMARALDILLSVVVFIAKTLLAAVLLIVVLCAVWLALLALAAWLRARKKHDPVEYYRGWGGYWHPIGLHDKITKQRADAIAADGNAYLIGYYDRRKLVRVTKMLKGEVFFDSEYTYHPNGKLKNVKTTNAKGVVKVREYDRRGRALPGNPGGLW